MTQKQRIINLFLSIFIVAFSSIILVDGQQNTSPKSDTKSLMKPKLPVISKTDKVDTTKKKSSKTNVVPSKTSVQIHEVKSKETLYSISKQYGVSTEEIQKMNNMTDFSLKIGQKLIIKKGSDSTNVPPKKKPTSDLRQPYIPQGLTTTRIYESGIARVIEGPSKSKKLLVLHRFAPIGKKIQIKNMANGEYVFAKVIGKMPPSSDEKIIIKMSPIAFEQLNARDSQCAVEVSYESSRKKAVK